MTKTKLPETLETGIHLNWHQALETFDQLIRAGQSQQVVSMLSTVRVKDIPRPYLQKFAHTFYRVGLFTEGLRALAPLLHSKENSREPASEIEIATYAVLLVKIGSVLEAKKLLSDLSSQLPEVDLYQAFAEQAEWDYEKAIPHLRRYLSRSQLSNYERAVAEVNLAASLISVGEAIESKAILASLLEQARTQQWTLIYKNTQELLGQLAVTLGSYEQAQQLLTEAASKEQYRQNGLFDFFIDKWKAFVELKQNPLDTRNQQQIQKIRSRAIELRHWESLRECDRVLSLALHNLELLNQVYFGTIFPAYRQRLLKAASPWSTPSSTYIWGSSEGLIFDLNTAESNDSGLDLKPGQALHRALAALASERYRPLYVGQLFSRIFPGEAFIAEFSEGRVAAVISRIRKWASQHQLPIAIEVKDQFYQLQFTSGDLPFGFQFHFESPVEACENSMAAQLGKLQKKMETNFFSSTEAAQKLEISKSSAVRLLGWALTEGKLITVGNQKTRKYGFVA